MKIASKTKTDIQTQRTHRETLIETELGAYFIVDEDLSTGEAASRRISMAQAIKFLAIVKDQTAQEIKLPEVVY
jgi:hypothetical protein